MRFYISSGAPFKQLWRIILHQEGPKESRGLKINVFYCQQSILCVIDPWQSEWDSLCNSCYERWRLWKSREFRHLMPLPRSYTWSAGRNSVLLKMTNLVSELCWRVNCIWAVCVDWDELWWYFETEQCKVWVSTCYLHSDSMEKVQYELIWKSESVWFDQMLINQWSPSMVTVRSWGPQPRLGRACA